MASPRERLMAARNATGRSPEDVASAIGVNSPTYYDMEQVDGEMEDAIPLGVLRKLSMELGISLSELLTGKPTVFIERISLEKLAATISEHLNRNHQSIDDFEVKVGFEIRGCLNEPGSILEWGVECLQSVCSELAVNWILALP